MIWTPEFYSITNKFDPVIADPEFARVYYSNPKNFANYINDFVIPKFHELAENKNGFSDFCNLHIKIFKAQVDLNLDLFILNSDIIIDTIIKMRDMLVLSANISPEKKKDLIDDLTYIICHLHLRGSENIKNLIKLYTELGGNLKNLNIISIEADCDNAGNKLYYVVRNPMYGILKES